MDTLGNAILGITFLLLSAAGTFLMYRLWGYPFDHEKLRSTAPPRLMMVHRFIGYAYAVIYLYLMTQMVPRLWTYEVEFPARTVAHMILGMTIGIIIVVKVSIVRFFKHLESTLVPFLGTGLFICTFLLIGLSVPFALKEVYLHRSTVGGSAFSPENIERVKYLLPKAGFPEAATLEELATVKSLRQGRDVLLSKCVQCHDLRTVLVKPRTPDNWVQTVNRMAERAVFNPISEEEQWRVASYLIAISPELQKTFKQKRQQDMFAVKSRVAAETAVRTAPLKGAVEKIFDLGLARKTFEATCTQCHKLSNVEKSPPASAQDARELVARMVDNGLEATEQELEQIVFYLRKTYAN
jgi:mono/diheme cytochrome c family protein